MVSFETLLITLSRIKSQKSPPSHSLGLTELGKGSSEDLNTGWQLFRQKGNFLFYVQDFGRLVGGVKVLSNRKPKVYFFLSENFRFLLFVQKGLCIVHKPRCCVQVDSRTVH